MRFNKQLLLQNQEVVNEINRHKWIMSESVGYDVGFDAAALDWLDKYGKNWFEKNISSLLKEMGNSNQKKEVGMAVAKKKAAKKKVAKKKVAKKKVAKKKVAKKKVAKKKTAKKK